MILIINIQPNYDFQWLQSLSDCYTATQYTPWFCNAMKLHFKYEMLIINCLPDQKESLLFTLEKYNIAIPTIFMTELEFYDKSVRTHFKIYKHIQAFIDNPLNLHNLLLTIDYIRDSRSQSAIYTF